MNTFMGIKQDEDTALMLDYQPLSISGSVFKALQESGILDLRKKEKNFWQWFKKLDVDTVIRILERLNESVHDCVFIDRLSQEDPIVFSPIKYLAPDNLQKYRLLEEGLAKIQNLDNHWDMALASYYLLEALNLYDDTNHQVSEVVYKVLSCRDLTKEGLDEILDYNRSNNDVIKSRFDLLEQAFTYAHREIAKKVLGKDIVKACHDIYLKGISSGEIVLPVAIKKAMSEDSTTLTNKLSDSQYPFAIAKLAVFQLVEHNCLFDLIYPMPRDGAVQACIDVEALFEKMTVNDSYKLLDNYQKLKNAFVEILIDIFANKENYNMADETGRKFNLATFLLTKSLLVKSNRTGAR